MGKEMTPGFGVRFADDGSSTVATVVTQAKL